MVDQDAAVFLDKDGMVYKLALCLGEKLAPDDADEVVTAQNADQLAFGRLAVSGVFSSDLCRQVFWHENGP